MKCAKVPKVLWFPSPGSGAPPQPELSHSLTIKRSSDDFWCFPRAHLVSYHCPAPTRLLLRFATHEVGVSCGDAEKLLETILKGTRAHLEVTGPEGTGSLSQVPIQQIDAPKVAPEYEIPSAQPGPKPL